MAKQSRVLPVLLLALAAVFAPAADEATFRLTGVADATTPYSTGQALSRDGATVLVESVVGSNYDRFPFLWTAVDGLKAPLNGPSSGTYSFSALSGNGRTLVGQHNNWAAYWDRNALVTGLEHPAGFTGSTATSASYDGTVIVGYGYQGAIQLPVRWERNVGHTLLDMSGYMYSGASKVSEDGSTALGYVSPNGSLNIVCTWNSAGVRTNLELPLTANADSPHPVDVSGDGTIVLGRVTTTSGMRPCLWTPNGWRNLGPYPGDSGNMIPTALSADGTVAVGAVNTMSGGRAFIWDKASGVRDLQTVLIEAGLGPQLNGWEVGFPSDVTVLPSGAIVVTGSCRNSNNETQAFIATIPGDASFTPVGDFDGGNFDSVATGLSADGETVVGYGHTGAGKQAFVWKIGRGMFDIGPGAKEATGASANGSVVVGVRSPGGFRWNQDGASRWLGTDAKAGGISANGLVTVGSSIGPDGVRHAYRWNGAATERYTTYIGNRVVPSHATAASANGSIFVGSTEPHVHNGVAIHRRAFLWRSSGDQSPMQDLPGGRIESEALAVSANGSVAVGWSHSANGPEACRWTNFGVVTPLGDLPGPGFASRALAVSQDGGVVVGMGVSNGKNRAFLWADGYGMRDLRSLLVQAGATEVLQWELSAATGVTVDSAGRIYVSGYGVDGNGHRQAFHATLPKLSAAPLRP